MAQTDTDTDTRAGRFRWAVAIVPLLAMCCAMISLLVAMGVVDLFYTLFTHHRLFTLR